MRTYFKSIPIDPDNWPDWVNWLIALFILTCIVGSILNHYNLI